MPNMETAVNFLMDGQPLIGEQVVVFGQGVVGLLTTALLARLPLARLLTLDRYPLRRQASLALGAHASLDPAEPQELTRLHTMLQQGQQGADLTYELSGNPAALDQAIAATGFSGRVVIGSWYGQKRADINLGGRFHRSRMRLISSQVSTLAPQWTGRWSKARRLQVAWWMLEQVRPAHLITHRFPLAQAAQRRGPPIAFQPCQTSIMAASDGRQSRLGRNQHQQDLIQLSYQQTYHGHLFVFCKLHGEQQYF